MRSPLPPTALSAAGDEVATWMSGLLACVDAQDTPGFLTYLADDASFRFANYPAAIGREAVGAAVSGFFTSIKGLRHELQRAWAPPGHAICEGIVTYTRHDGSTLTAPFVNVFTMRNGLVADYRIYVDASALYAPAQ